MLGVQNILFYWLSKKLDKYIPQQDLLGKFFLLSLSSLFPALFTLILPGPVSHLFCGTRFSTGLQPAPSAYFSTFHTSCQVISLKLSSHQKPVQWHCMPNKLYLNSLFLNSRPSKFRPQLTAPIFAPVSSYCCQNRLYKGTFPSLPS